MCGLDSFVMGHSSAEDQRASDQLLRACIDAGCDALIILEELQARLASPGVGIDLPTVRKLLSRSADALRLAIGDLRRADHEQDLLDPGFVLGQESPPEDLSPGF